LVGRQAFPPGGSFIPQKGRDEFIAKDWAILYGDLWNTGEDSRFGPKKFQTKVVVGLKKERR